MKTDQAMRVRFWGVRGSYPVPGAQTLSYGGNTACVEVQTGERTLILDGGTGLIPLGRELLRRASQTGKAVEAALFFSHMHHDHIQGFPFFAPAFLPATRLHLLGTGLLESALEDVLGSTMSPPTFPISLRELGAERHFYGLRETDMVCLDQASGEVSLKPPDQAGAPANGEVRVRCLASHAHPGGVMIYRIEWNNFALVYATDTEGYIGGDRRLVNFARGADLLIHDAQYTEEHYHGQLAGYPSTQGWGHSTPGMACAVARAAGIRQLVLFHHEPQYADDRIHALEEATQQDFPGAISAYEGLEIEVGLSAATLCHPLAATEASQQIFKDKPGRY
jgi:phosphoribosyl 1,2-cyclic phosphodiesterase